MVGGWSVEHGIRFAQSKRCSKEISSADYPQIRYYKVPRKFYPEHEVSKASWRVCSPQTAPEFSAIAYYFSRNIHKELNIPIGIIQTPVGGTTVEAWTSRSLLMSDKDFRPIVQHYDSIVNSYGSDGYEKLYNRYVSSLAEYHQLNAEQKSI